MADNTASLVVALSAQLTKFEKDMRDAGIMAEKATKDIEGKFSKMNPQVSSSFLGNFFSNAVTKGISAAEEAIKDVIKRFEELQQTAKYTETSLQWVYGLQQAFKQSGSSVDDLNKSLSSVSQQLDQIKRGNTTNALFQLFSANGVDPKNINSAADALAKVADILQTIRPNERLEVVSSLGLPTGAVEALERGGAALKALAAEAARTGPSMEQAAAATKALADIWDEFTKKIREGWSEPILAGLRPIVGVLLAIQEAQAGLFKGTGGWLEKTSSNELAKWQKISDLVNQVSTFNERWNALGKAAPDAPKPKYTGVDPFGLNAPKADTKDAYDREVNSINKQIAALQAEAATVGETAGAQEEYRVQLLLSEKAAEAGKDMTLELNDAIATQATRAAEAKQALAEHQFQLNKLNAASQVVGQSLSTAFTDAIVDGKKLNEVFADLIKTLEKAALNSLIMSFFNPGAGQSTSMFGGLLSGLFGGGSAGSGSAMGTMQVGNQLFPKYASGTLSAPGGMAVVGEQGPELVNLPRGSQVIPNSVARSMGAGGQITYAPAIDARGASVDAVARLAQILAEDRASFASRTVATIQQARRGRVPGI